MPPPSAVELELWRIFTYYTLHADPTSPESFKIAHFIRFAKDCQIISNKFSKAILTLELAKVVRNRKEFGDEAHGETIYFRDFVRLLEYLAPMVYSERSPHLSMRRLLLENVFLLAGRRIPVDVNFSPSDEDTRKLMTDKFGRSLQNIFNHYIDMAARRRTQEAVAEKMRAQQAQVRLDQLGLGRGTVAHEKISEGAAAGGAANAGSAGRSAKKSSGHRHAIGHKEFFQFCQDFKLKSSALLSAIQVGEVYLTAVPLEESGSSEERDMDVDRFSRAIVLMSLVAFREAPARVPPMDKVKALLLYMWRTINSREKTQQAVQTRNGTSKTVEGHAGSLNLHGSGLFSVTLQDMWKDDGFPGYVTRATALGAEDSRLADGADALGRIGQSAAAAADTGASFPSSPLVLTRGRSLSSSANTPGGVANRGAKAQLLHSTYGGALASQISSIAGFDDDLFLEPGATSAAAKSAEAASPDKGPSTDGQKRHIYGYQIAELFRRKPELGEFFFLEILTVPVK